MKIDLVVESPISTSVRAAQVSSMFDVPPQEKARLEWHGDLPIEGRDWNIGLIVGPSGSGKSSILNAMFGKPAAFEWPGASVIDDIAEGGSVQDVAQICQAVGFNTIPAWLRPYGVLSNGEKFRVDLARRMIEGGELVPCDEFTSVVDRQVARIGAHAVQKYIRRAGRRFVAATCHYDLEDWLQPDWVLEPATMTFRWRAVQRRPDIECEVRRVHYSAWQIFSRFHYLTAHMHVGCKCFVLLVDGQPATFLAILHRPHPNAKDIWGGSRIVTMPDFQGLGLALALCDQIAAACRAIGWRLRVPPVHPVFVRSFNRSPMWDLVKPPGMTGSNRSRGDRVGRFGGRPGAIFEYCGPALDDVAMAHRLLA